MGKLSMQNTKQKCLIIQRKACTGYLHHAYIDQKGLFPKESNTDCINS